MALNYVAVLASPISQSYRDVSQKYEEPFFDAPWYVTNV
jgi:hypothetical protein